MRLRSVLIYAFACTVLSTGVIYADGMPGPEDERSPVPSSAPPPYPPKPASSSATPAPPSHPSSAAVTQPAAPVVSPPPPPPPSVQTSTPAPAPAAPPPSAATNVTPSPAPTPPASGPVAQKAIYEVTGIDVGVSKDKPSFVTVVVKGSSRTGGWTNAQLKPLQTFAPEVGMRSFTFVATPPTGASTQSMAPIQATIKIDPLPADVKTIRVLSETNEIAQTFR